MPPESTGELLAFDGQRHVGQHQKVLQVPAESLDLVPDEWVADRAMRFACQTGGLPAERIGDR